jgi:3-deoxy-D-arabino-heptulosonate 7-phosphate (DAHP) synthase class II
MNYKGDNVNCSDRSKRDADPKKLVEGYFKSAATMNYIRALESTDVIKNKADKLI